MVDLDVDSLLHGEREHRPYGEGRIDLWRQVDAFDYEVDFDAGAGNSTSLPSWDTSNATV